MTQSISGSKGSFSTCYTSLKASTIESHPAWHNRVDFNEINTLLEKTPPFTFILSSLDRKDTYLLSYVRADHVVSHVQFTRDGNKDAWCYTNGQDNEHTLLDEMIKNAMHCEEDSIPTPLCLTSLQPLNRV